MNDLQAHHDRVIARGGEAGEPRQLAWIWTAPD
jgi:hypothetical protein